MLLGVLCFPEVGREWQVALALAHFPLRLTLVKRTHRSSADEDLKGVLAVVRLVGRP